MSEKQPQIIDEAFAAARRDHKFDIADAKTAQTLGVAGYGKESREKRSYSYNGDGYHESLVHEGDQYADGKNTDATEIASGDDAVLQREMWRSYGNAGYESTDTQHLAKVNIPITEGTAEYKAETRTRDTKAGSSVDKSETVIVRKDAAGNEVYRFTSRNPALAEKIGAVAAKRIIASVSDTSLDKAA